jgi:dTDP-4-dehydrorhamnose reductase
MANSPPSALIIGASGQVGRHCLMRFQGRDYRVVGSYSSRKQEGLVHLDLTRTSDVRALVREASPRICVLSSAVTNVDRCEDEPHLARAINADAAEVLAIACRDVGAKLIFLSTEYVFDGDSGPYDESAATHPISIYGQTKLEGERRVLQASANNLVVRTTVVYSWEVAGKNFVMQVLARLGAGQSIRLPIDQMSSPTHAGDLAGAIVKLVALGSSGVVNAVGPEVLDRHRFGKMIAETFGLPLDKIEPIETRALGQKARRPLRAGLLDGRLASLIGRRLRRPAEGLAALREEKGA